MSMPDAMTVQAGQSTVCRFTGLLAGLTCGLLAFAAPASAESEGIPFGGAVSHNNSCSILIERNGTMALSADGMVFSSKLAGGVSGQALIQSGATYWITATTYQFWNMAPPDGGTATTFASFFSGRSLINGASFAELPSNYQVRFNSGYQRVRVNVNLVATRTGSVFPPGNYRSEVVIRCE